MRQLLALLPGEDTQTKTLYLRHLRQALDAKRNRFGQLHLFEAQDLLYKIGHGGSRIHFADWLSLQRDYVLTGESPLLRARDATFRFFARTRSYAPQVSLMMWGSRHNAGLGFFADLAAVAKWRPVELAQLYGEIDFSTVLREWVLACNITHPLTRRAADRLIEHLWSEELSKHPKEGFVPLDYLMGTKALELAAKDFTGDDSQFKRLAFYLFSVFSRIAAYENAPGYVRFRSEWLRGTGTNSRAIPGASTSCALLTKIIHEEVLERVQGHSTGGPGGVGAKAATYKLRFPILRGAASRAQFAKHLGLQLDSKDRPRVSASAAEASSTSVMS